MILSVVIIIITSRYHGCCHCYYYFIWAPVSETSLHRDF